MTVSQSRADEIDVLSIMMSAHAAVSRHAVCDDAAASDLCDLSSSVAVRTSLRPHHRMRRDVVPYVAAQGGFLRRRCTGPSPLPSLHHHRNQYVSFGNRPESKTSPYPPHLDRDSLDALPAVRVPSFNFNPTSPSTPPLPWLRALGLASIPDSRGLIGCGIPDIRFKGHRRGLLL